MFRQKPRVRPLCLQVLATFALLLLVRPSEACTRRPAIEDVWSKYVVFVGVALERAPAPNYRTATRYRVEASNQLEPGEEVTIFYANNSCGGGTHPAGVRGIVIAKDDGSVLTTSLGLWMTREERRAVLHTFGLPEGFAFEAVTSSGPAGECTSPTTIASAFDASDAVLGARDRASCFNEGLGMVETAIEAHSIYKGPSISEWFVVLRAPQRFPRRTKEDREFVETYRNEWPPAEFLREIPNLVGQKEKTYVNDGCLTPVHPQGSYQDVTALLTKYFPRPAPQVSLAPPKAPLPRLSCATLGKDMVWKAQMHLRAHRARMKSRVLAPLLTPPSQEDTEDEASSETARRGKGTSLGGADGADVRPNSRVEDVSTRGTQKPSSSNVPPRSGCASCSSGRDSAESRLSLLFGVGLLGLSCLRRSKAKRSVSAPS